MSDFKEFQGKTLDAAIADACAYYDAPREKLEIEIIEDAKSGIFGIVGARKARIHARRAQLPDLGRTARDRKERNTPLSTDAPHSEIPSAAEENSAEDNAERQERAPLQKGQEERPKKRGRRGNGRNEREGGENGQSACVSAGEADNGNEAQENEAAQAGPDSEAQRGRKGRSGRGGEADISREAAETENSAEQDGYDLPPRVALTELDQEKLVQVTTDIVHALVESIADDAALEVNVSEDRLQVRVDCADTGLLIGRDGQNLAAVQYLATRMIARAMDAQIRLQLDAGDYHSRQDSRLQELAISLAEKVKLTGRSQSTRPLSAYQRRLIHLCLQDDPDVQTRSSGEGAMKRVVILRRRDREYQED